MTNPKIFISTSNYKKKYSNQLNDILESNEVNNSLEIASGHFTDAMTKEKISTFCNEDYEVLFHNYSFREKHNLMINLCELDEYKSGLIIDYIYGMIDNVKALGGDYYSIHGGFYPDRLVNHEKKKYQKQFLNQLLKVLDYADSKNIIIGVENHVVEKKNVDKLYLFNIEEFAYLFDQIKHKNLRLHLDVGHLKISANTYGFSKEEFILKFKHLIYAVHLHDNDGVVDSHQRFNEESYFIKYLNELKILKYIVIESWNQESKLIEEMVRCIDDIYK